MSRKYKFHEAEGAYFISFATVNWIDVFVRQEYFAIIVDSLNFCVKQKDMEVFAWCIMPSHVHLVFRSTKEKPQDLIRDIKGFTSKKILQAISENNIESRKEWMLETFAKAGKENGNNVNYQFWQQHNKPIHVYSNHVIDQKIDYVHNNPVKAGFVEEAHQWLHSSARDYNDETGLVKIVLP